MLFDVNPRPFLLGVGAALLFCAASGASGADVAFEPSAPPAMPVDVERLTRACALREDDACLDLGIAFETGDGVPHKNLVRARDLYASACDRASVAACARLAALSLCPVGHACGRGFSVAVPAGMHVAVEGEWDRANPEVLAVVEHIRKSGEAHGLVLLLSSSSLFTEALVEQVVVVATKPSKTTDPVERCARQARRIMRAFGRGARTPAPLQTPLGPGCQTRLLNDGLNYRVVVVIDGARDVMLVASVVGRANTAAALDELVSGLRWRAPLSRVEGGVTGSR